MNVIKSLSVRHAIVVIYCADLVEEWLADFLTSNRSAKVNE